jgi:integrase
MGSMQKESSVRTREYLTTVEIELLMAAARKSSRCGHRDATMILMGYRHGLRASELCDLQWSQVELASGRLHVRRTKNGSPSVPCGACSASKGHPRSKRLKPPFGEQPGLRSAAAPTAALMTEIARAGQQIRMERVRNVTPR